MTCRSDGQRYLSWIVWIAVLRIGITTERCLAPDPYADIHMGGSLSWHLGEANFAVMMCVRKLCN